MAKRGLWFRASTVMLTPVAMLTRARLTPGILRLRSAVIGRSTFFDQQLPATCSGPFVANAAPEESGLCRPCTFADDKVVGQHMLFL